MIPPEQFDDDHDTELIAQESTQRQPYPTSGTRQVEGNELKITEETEDMASFSGLPSIKGSTESMRMLLLTFSIIGLQYVSSKSWCRRNC
jgi:hypothetical protein